MKCFYVLSVWEMSLSNASEELIKCHVSSMVDSMKWLTFYPLCGSTTLAKSFVNFRYHVGIGASFRSCHHVNVLMSGI